MTLIDLLVKSAYVLVSGGGRSDDGGSRGGDLPWLWSVSHGSQDSHNHCVAAGDAEGQCRNNRKQDGGGSQ